MRVTENVTIRRDVDRCDLCDSECTTLPDQHGSYMPVRSAEFRPISLVFLHDSYPEHDERVDLCIECRNDLTAFIQCRADNNRGSVER